MNCEQVQNRFLEMDNRSAIPVSVHLHMIICPRCRRYITALNRKFESLRDEAPFAMDRDLCENIMKQVFLSEVRYEHHVSGFQWGLVGFIILGSMFLIPFSHSFGWLRNYFGANLELPVSIVLGLVFSIYASVGIFSNMDQLKKFVESLPRKL